MTNALQEQLLKAGLATKEQIEKANQPRRPRKHHKKQSQNKSRHTKPAHKKATDGMDLKDAFAARRREERNNYNKKLIYAKKKSRKKRQIAHAEKPTKKKLTNWLKKMY